VYAYCSYLIQEPRDTFPYKAALVLSFYGFLTGLCLRRIASDGQQSTVAFALVCFALCLAYVALVILLAPGADRIISSSAGSEISRANTNENEAVTYLGLFSIENIIIGLIPFTLFGLSLFPVLLTARNLPIRLLALGVMILAAYINLQIATRTTFAASMVSTVLILMLVVRQVPFRRRLVFAGMLILMSIGGYIYVTRNKDIFHFIANRFGDVTQDSRIMIWKEALHILVRTPEGSGIRKLTSHFWAHNLFLDVGLANGWFALAAIIALCAVAFVFAWRCFMRGGFADSTANIIMLGWLISSFLALMVLPPLPPLLGIFFVCLAFFAPYESSPVPDF